jgi:hypothetical protein
MASQRIRTGLFGSAVALGVALLLLVFHPRLSPLRRAISAMQTRPAAAGDNRPGALAKAAGPTTEERSRLGDSLNAPSGDVHADLRQVNAIFVAFRGAVRTENPVGENAEITAVLAGHNKLGYAFIPSDIPAINPKGELCDRWGMPYFFHQLSGQKMEIRSAGPDRRLWTADDEVLTP